MDNTRTSSTTPADHGRRLRMVLRANAVTSGVGGLAGVVAADWWARRLGVADVVIVRGVAASLVGFAGAVWWTSTQHEARMRAGARLTSVADLVWVLASIWVAAIGSLTTFGTVMTVVLAVGVADFAVLQTWFGGQLRRSSTATGSRRLVSS